ncbi:ATP-binding protein, partial [Amycolatopsis rubida]
GGPARADAPAAAPVQLPPRRPALVGRDAELARLEDILRRCDPAPPVVVLTGIGGVGKTALALGWLYGRLDAFPDAVLYARLSADIADPASTALHGFLRALGVPGREIPPSPHQRAALFRGLTADLRFAILIEDAARSEDVSALLPGSTAAFVLVTARTQLVRLLADGAEEISVDPLEDAPASQVLAFYARRDGLGPAAERLLAACGGLPLALAVTGSRLRHRPCRAPEREVRRIDAQPKGIAAMADALDSSYAALDEFAARAYRACGFLPGPHLDRAALSHTLQRLPGFTDDDLDDLVDAHLLRDVDDDTVDQHDAVRRHARALAEQVDDQRDRDRLLDRYTRWYRDRTVAASTLIHPHRPGFAAATAGIFADRDAALAWWTRDLPVINAVADDAADRGRHEELWQIAEASWGYFLYHRDYPPFLRLFTAGLRAARACGEPVAEARMLHQIGFVHRKLGNVEEAVAHDEAAAVIGEREQHALTLATAASRAAWAAEAHGDPERALDLYEDSAEKHAHADRPRGVGLARLRRGNLLITLGRDPEALTELAAAAEIMVEQDDPAQHAEVLVALAGIFERQGDDRSARDHLARARENVEPLRSPHFQNTVDDALAALDRRTAEACGEAARQEIR